MRCEADATRYARVLLRDRMMTTRETSAAGRRWGYVGPRRLAWAQPFRPPRRRDGAQPRAASAIQIEARTAVPTASTCHARSRRSARPDPTTAAATIAPAAQT